jgi:hypothetical protein
LKQTTLNSLKQLYEKLEVITRELYDLAEIELELEDFDDASLLQTRADILFGCCNLRARGLKDDGRTQSQNQGIG